MISTDCTRKHAVGAAAFEILVLSDRNRLEGFNPTLEQQDLQTIFRRNPNIYMLILSEPLELYRSQDNDRKGRERLNVCV